MTKKEIIDEFTYLAFCDMFDKDFFGYTKTRDEYNEFLKNTEYHDGDCTKVACPCSRCHLQTCEIEAQRLFNYLTYLKILKIENGKNLQNSQSLYKIIL